MKTHPSSKTRNKHIANGLCGTCGKIKPAFLSTECQPCLDKHKKRSALRRFQKRIYKISFNETPDLERLKKHEAEAAKRRAQFAAEDRAKSK